MYLLCLPLVSPYVIHLHMQLTVTHNMSLIVRAHSQHLAMSLLLFRHHFGTAASSEKMGETYGLMMSKTPDISI